MKTAIADAKKLAYSKKSPPKILIEISEKKALELCDKFPEADKNIVQLSIFLMDIMLTEALAANKISEHVKMSVEATKEFLNTYDFSQKDKNKI